MSKEINFDKVWEPVNRVIEYQRLDYPEAVTIGGQFSILKAEIERLRKENKRYRELLKGGKQ